MIIELGQGVRASVPQKAGHWGRRHCPEKNRDNGSDPVSRFVKLIAVVVF